jgi:hypothetical protein
MRIVAADTCGTVLLIDLECRRLELLHPGMSGEFVTRRPTSSDLKIVVDKEAAIVVFFKPVVQMNLVQIRSDDFLAQFMGFRTQDRNVQSGEDSDQGLQNAIRVNVGMSIRRLHLAKRG